MADCEDHVVRVGQEAGPGSIRLAEVDCPRAAAPGRVSLQTGEKGGPVRNGKEARGGHLKWVDSKLESVRLPRY